MRRTFLTIFLLALGAFPMAAQQNQPVRRGQAIPGTLSSDGEHTYTLDLDADRFVFGEVDQHTVDVVVAIMDPDGEQVASFDGPSRGLESFFFETEGAGAYTIRITPFEEAAGDYTLLVRRVERVATDPEDRVDQLMAPYSGDHTPGVVVSVMEGGEVAFARGYGMANLEHGIPFDERTISNIGSVTKQFTAMGLLLLQNEGKLSIDDDIRTYIPELPDFGVPITLKNLLNHTGGYREFYNILPMTGAQGEDAVRREMAISIVQNQPELQAQPNTEFNYNNTGFILLATTIERVSGMSYPEYMKANVFGPLGMTRTQVKGYQGQVIPGSAQGYVVAEEDGAYRSARDLGASYGAGGIYTTAQDMAKWMRNYRDATLGGPEAIQATVTTAILESGDSTGYGLGMGVREMGGQRVYTHTGGDTAHRTYFAYFPDLDAGVYVSSNNGSFSTGLGAQVARIFFAEHMDEDGAVAESGDDEAGVEWSAERLEAITGDWVIDAQGQIIDVEFIVEDGSAFAQVTGQPRVAMVPTSDSTFTLTGVEADVTFSFDIDGSVDSGTLVQGAAVALRRMEPVEMTTEDLLAYQGRYFSRELEVFYELKVVDGELMGHHRELESFALTHREGEQFAGPWFFASVEFVRAGNGAVTGFLAGNGRTKGVLFQRW